MARKQRSSSTRRRKATKGRRRYSRKASREVRTEMHHLKQGKHGRRLKSRKQAIAIGLSKARKHGAKVPKKR